MPVRTWAQKDGFAVYPPIDPLRDADLLTQAPMRGAVHHTKRREGFVQHPKDRGRWPYIPPVCLVLRYVAVAASSFETRRVRLTSEELGPGVTDLRRRLPRQEAHWQGKYTVEGGTSGAWGACEILDVSILGAGLELFEHSEHLLPNIDTLIGDQILVEVQTPAGASITLQMLGEIRYTTVGKRGGVRVGIQFHQLSETEQAILNVLEQMQAVW